MHFTGTEHGFVKCVWKTIYYAVQNYMHKLYAAINQNNKHTLIKYTILNLLLNLSVLAFHRNPGNCKNCLRKV